MTAESYALQVIRDIMQELYATGHPKPIQETLLRRILREGFGYGASTNGNLTKMVFRAIPDFAGKPYEAFGRAVFQRQIRAGQDIGLEETLRVLCYDPGSDEELYFTRGYHAALNEQMKQWLQLRGNNATLFQSDHGHEEQTDGTHTTSE